MINLRIGCTREAGSGSFYAKKEKDLKKEHFALKRRVSMFTNIFFRKINNILIRKTLVIYSYVGIDWLCSMQSMKDSVVSVFLLLFWSKLGLYEKDLIWT